MGFLDEIKEIFKYLPKKRQTLMFSATMPKQIKDLAVEILIILAKFTNLPKKGGGNKTQRNIKPTKNFYWLCILGKLEGRKELDWALKFRI